MPTNKPDEKRRFIGDVVQRELTHGGRFERRGKVASEHKTNTEQHDTKEDEWSPVRSNTIISYWLKLNFHWRDRGSNLEEPTKGNGHADEKNQADRGLHWGRYWSGEVSTQSNSSRHVRTPNA